MKKRFLAYAFLLAAIVSVTSGCMVHERYGYHNRYHHDRYYHDHYRGY